jgi:hypothetical protein
MAGKGPAFLVKPQFFYSFQWSGLYGISGDWSGQALYLVEHCSGKH